MDRAIFYTTSGKIDVTATSFDLGTIVHNDDSKEKLPFEKFVMAVIGLLEKRRLFSLYIWTKEDTDFKGGDVPHMEILTRHFIKGECIDRIVCPDIKRRKK